MLYRMQDTGSNYPWGAGGRRKDTGLLVYYYPQDREPTDGQKACIAISTLLEILCRIAVSKGKNSPSAGPLLIAVNSYNAIISVEFINAISNGKIIPKIRETKIRQNRGFPELATLLAKEIGALSRSQWVLYIGSSIATGWGGDWGRLSDGTFWK